MSTTTAPPATTPIPVQLSESEFTTFLLPHLSMPKRGPKCKLGYYRVFNLILWLLYTGMQWKCLPVPTDSDGKPAIHYTTVYKVFAKWADDGSLWQAFIASVAHLAAEKQLDVIVTTHKTIDLVFHTQVYKLKRGMTRKNSVSASAIAFMQNEVMEVNDETPVHSPATDCGRPAPVGAPPQSAHDHSGTPGEQ